MAPDDDAADLRARVQELEQTLADHQATIEQLRDRGVGRRALLAGGAGLVGGAALTGQASAQSAAGQVGTSSEPVDVAAASVTADSVDAGSVNTRELGSARHYAGAYSGTDADVRLDNALTDASDGDTIMLENADYSSSHTISTQITLVGTQGAQSVVGTSISGAWTVDSRVHIYNIGVAADASVTLNGGTSALIGSIVNITATITISADSFRYINNHSGNVIFESGTSGGLVDSCTGTTVTDNGSNTIGDIA